MNHDLASADAVVIREQAAQWLVDLTASGINRRAAFTKWVTQSPRHIEEFLLASATYKAVGEVPGETAQTIDDIITEALAASDRDNVVPLPRSTIPGRRPSDRGPRTSLRLWAVASSITACSAAAVAACIWFFGLSIPFMGSTYATKLGEQRSVRLQDGSLVYLNARSKVRLSFSSRVRTIVLIDGEAIFKVAHERRPFRVHVGDTVVEALGTEFNINRSANGGRVSVLEGKVRLSSDQNGVPSGTNPLLLAGEEAAILRNGTIAKAADPNVMATVAWRERRLVFRDEPLTYITQEFSRFSPLRIHLADDVSRNVRLTGTLDADDTQALVAFLESSPRLHVERVDNGYIVRGR